MIFTFIQTVQIIIIIIIASKILLILLYKYNKIYYNLIQKLFLYIFLKTRFRGDGSPNYFIFLIFFFTEISSPPFLLYRQTPKTFKKNNDKQNLNLSKPNL